MSITAGIKFDWISFTLPRNHNDSTLPALVKDLFGLDFLDFKLKEKKRNYYRRSYLLESPNGDKLVEIFSDPDTIHNQGTTLFQVSGFALSAYAVNPLAIDVPDLFRKFLELGGKPTCLHLAMDDLSSQLPWLTILDYSSPENWQQHIVSTSRRQPISLNNQTIYFGQRKDRNSICIYRKDQQEGTKFPWIRVEYRTTDRSTAKAIAEKIAAGADLGPMAAGLIRRFLDFKEPSIKTKYNRATAQWWLDFCGDVEKMIISRDLAPKRKAAPQPPKPKKMEPIINDLARVMNPTFDQLDAVVRWLIDQGHSMELAKFDSPMEPLLNIIENNPITWAPEITF